MEKPPPPPPPSQPPPASPSTTSLAKNQKLKRMPSVTDFASISEDLVLDILQRLPAVSFASAACVSKSWNQVCNRILSRPKFASAMSLDPSPHIAGRNVVEKVLSEPIRPHFAIANLVGYEFDFQMDELLKFLAAELGSTTPIILSSAYGIMGTDVITDEFKEVMPTGGFFYSDGAFFYGDDEEDMDGNSGIVLTVGFVPGLKVEAIPFLPHINEPENTMEDKFVMDIMNYAVSTQLVGVIMFGDRAAYLRPILEKLDYAVSKETIIVGVQGAQFLYRTGLESDNCSKRNPHSDAIALVFARDREKAHGIGEIQFHTAVSNGVCAIGPRYKAASLRVCTSDMTTWLTARREGQQERLDGERILNDIYDELGDRIEHHALFIGVAKQRKYAIGLEKSRLMTSLTSHYVMGEEEEYLLVDDIGIRIGDSFQFYHPDPATALSSCGDVSVKLRKLKLDCNTKNCPKKMDLADSVGKKEFLGGFIFSSCGRGESFFGRPKVDSSPFLENFPGLPFAGLFSSGEIGRGLSFNAQELQDGGTARLCLDKYSTVYLLVSYSPAPLDH